MSYGIELAVLGERDAWTCWVCANDVDPDAVAGSPHAGSVDHVVPRARGGSNDAANLRLAHRRCNGQRGSSVPELDWPGHFQVFEPAPLWSAAQRALRRPGDWELVGVVDDGTDGVAAQLWLRTALTLVFAGAWETRTTPLSEADAAIQLTTLALRTPPIAAPPRHRGRSRRPSTRRR